MDKAFVCDRCGLCCENLHRSALYDDLNDGTGVCIYYDKKTHLCTVYKSRPEKCNVEASYKYFKDKLSYEKYLELNYESCKALKGGK